MSVLLSRAAAPSWVRSAAAFGLAAWALQSVARACLAALQAGDGGPAAALGAFLAGTRLDAGIALPLAVLVAAAGAAWRGHRAADRVGRCLSALLLAALAIALVADLLFVRHFGDRLNLLVWDFFTDRENARLVIRAVADEVRLAVLASALGTGLLAALAIGWLARAATRTQPRATLTAAMGMAALGLTALPGLALDDARPFVTRHPRLNLLADNPLYSLARAYRAREASADPSAPRPPPEREALSQLAAAISPRSSATEGGLLYATAPGAGPLARRPRHVVLVVLESYAAWPLEEAGLGEAVGRTVLGLAREGLSFEFHLPQAGGTLRNLQELLTSRPPPARLASHDDQSGDLRAGGEEALPHRLRRLGYRPLFTYGGSYDWQRLSSALPRFGFEALLGGIAAPANLASELGMPDGELYAIAARALREAREPTFLTILTTSNHPPYELPADFRPVPAELPRHLRERVLDPALARKRFAAFQYADRALGEFIEELRREPVFGETLFVITGDHALSGTLQHEPSRYLAERRVPMVLYGPVLARRGVRYAHATSHRDLMPTLVELLGDGAEALPAAGKSLFDEHPGCVLTTEVTCLGGRCAFEGALLELAEGLRLRPTGEGLGGPEGIRLLRLGRTFAGLAP